MRHAFPDSASLIAAAGSTDPSRSHLRVVIMTVGTRGDVQPFLALAAALTAAGHSVAVASTDDHAAHVAAAGVEFITTGSGNVEQPPEWSAPSTRTVAQACVCRVRECAGRAVSSAMEPRARRSVTVNTAPH